MTKNEAKERAMRIWGQPSAASQDATGWKIALADGTLHRLDANGHTMCHNHCAVLEGKARAQ